MTALPRGDPCALPSLGSCLAHNRSHEPRVAPEHLKMSGETAEQAFKSYVIVIST